MAAFDFNTVRQGLSAYRHLVNLRNTGTLIDSDFDRLLGKIGKGLEAAAAALLDPSPPALSEPVPAFDFAETMTRLGDLRAAIARECGTEPALLRGRKGRVILDEFAFDQASPPLELADHDYRRWDAGLPASRFRRPGQVDRPSQAERDVCRHPTRRVRGMEVIDGGRK